MSDNAADKRLSVIIPTHNRSESLATTLEALANQSLPREEFEIIVVDDGSRPEERANVRELREQFRFQLIEKENGGQGSARNLGARRAKGDYLYFLDDDIIPVPDALERILEAHAENGRDTAILGAWPFPEKLRRDPFIQFLERVGHYDLYLHRDKYPDGAPPLPPLNGNSSVARKLFEKSGGYDETFRRYGGEDMELGYQMKKSGVRFIYEPRVVGYHNHDKDFPRHCQDQVAAGEALAHIHALHPEIKSSKKIDVITGPMVALTWDKKLFRIIWLTTSTCPAILSLPRMAIWLGTRLPWLPVPLHQCYRWIAFYHYGRGIESGVRRSWSSSERAAAGAKR